MRRKIGVIFNILIIAFLSFSIIKPVVKAQTSSRWFDVKISPTAAGENAEYYLYDGICDFDEIDALKIRFQWDASFSSTNVAYGSVVVNSVAAKSASFSKLEKDIVLTALLGKKINKGDKVNILIKKEAGLINPTTPRICFYTQVTCISRGIDMGYIGSSQYEITQSIVTIKSVNVEPPLRGANAEYIIQFITGANGVIHSQTDDIRIRFPEGTNFKSSYLQGTILLNNQEPAAVYRDSDGSIRIYSSNEIKARSLVTVYFKKSSGIVNPLTSGLKTLEMSTYTEPDWVESPVFEIVEPEVKDLEIGFEKSFIGANSNINIYFKTSNVGFLPKGGKIYVEFSKEFTVPGNFLSGTVNLNGKSVTASAENTKLKITTDETIMQNQEVSIQITQDAMLINPTVPGRYEILLYTDSDLNKSPVAVDIVPSTVSEVFLSAIYSGFNSVNEFTIFFKTGPVYTLKSVSDIIMVKFEEGFVMPDATNQGLILVDRNVSPTVVNDVYALYITVPSDILPNSLVEVKIPEEFGIRNPSVLGEYGVSVSTTRETEEIQSNKIKITPLPVVEFTINPGSPDGLSGFYKTAPEVKLSTSNGTKVFFKIDEGEFKEYSESFKVPEGMHIVFAYAVDSGNNKGDIVKKEFLVDNTPPQIKFDNSLSDPYFKSSPGKLTGSVSEPCTLKINEAVLELKDDLNFTVELNVYDEMPIAVYLRDLAGNARTLLYTAHIDNTPPIISYVNSEFKLLGINSRVTETTESSYTIQLKLNEKGKVFVNGKEALFDGTTYTYFASLNDGDNQYEIRAVDSAGNETTETLNIKKVSYKVITLQIGNKIASFGSDTVELDASPFIENGYTLVPIRFISETFGAEVQWNEMLKVITIIYKGRTIQIQIGSTIAILDNSISKIDVAPKIVSNRTFVPLRFISETFGAQVNWDGTTKTITIIYTP